MTENFLNATDTENFSAENEGFSTVSAKVKRGRGRPRLTEDQKAAIRAKREAGKTRKFSVGEEPNRRS